jgi:2,4-dienoyl-CoA reductase-like NADH-dependent reductase (Old Yellow Enzyme family)
VTLEHTQMASAEMDMSPAVLFRPWSCGSLALDNRIVMSPMTRAKCPRGVPGRDVAAYYRRRAENGVGLIITGGTTVEHRGASEDPNTPCFHGAEALAGWKHVLNEVCAAGTPGARPASSTLVNNPALN